MHINRIFNSLTLPTALGLAALLSACGGGDGGSSTVATQGTLRVSLTDAPACGFEQVNVTVSKVRVHQSANAGENETGWQEIVVEPAKKIDLLSLTNGIVQELGATGLPAGRYTQMRLVLVSNSGTTPFANSVITEGGNTEIALDTPSAVQSGLKLNHAFDVASGEEVGLVLDFDACKSIVSRGNGSFSLKPVISVISTATSGGISGYVAAGMTNVMVSAQQDGIVVKSTVPDAKTGAFSLSPLPQNSTGYVVVISADGRASAAITGVPVTTGSTTPISTSTAPIAPATSAMRTINGVATPADAQVLVRATQNYAPAGPKVEVAFKTADLTSGAYSLSVPSAAPLLGQFGSGTLPIAFTGNSAAAGKYTVEATASGYTTKASAVDVSTADKIVDFELTP